MVEWLVAIDKEVVFDITPKWAFTSGEAIYSDDYLPVHITVNLHHDLTLVLNVRSPPRTNTVL